MCIFICVCTPVGGRVPRRQPFCFSDILFLFLSLTVTCGSLWQGAWFYAVSFSLLVLRLQVFAPCLVGLFFVHVELGIWTQLPMLGWQAIPTELSSQSYFPAFIYSVFACVCPCAATHTWRWEDNLQESVLSFHHVPSRPGLQIWQKAQSPAKSAHWSALCPPFLLSSTIVVGHLHTVWR